MKKLIKPLLFLCVLALFFVFFKYNLGQYFTLDYIKSQQNSFSRTYQQYPFYTIGLYMLIYITSTALSLPGAAILTLLGGALFGVVNGTIIVSFASTIGATLAFLTSRFLLRQWVQNKFHKHLNKVNEGIKKEGAFYLFSIRMIPAIPFFVVNLVMGLTPMNTRTYFFTSQAGMLAGTIVYVNAGTQLAQINSLKGILSPSLILSFCLLAIFPIISKKLIRLVQQRKSKESI